MAWKLEVEYIAGPYIVTAFGQRDKQCWVEIRPRAMNGGVRCLKKEYDFQTAQDVANAIALLLASDYTPEWLQEHFR